jgi:hypothetical protein
MNARTSSQKTNKKPEFFLEFKFKAVLAVVVTLKH